MSQERLSEIDELKLENEKLHEHIEGLRRLVEETRAREEETRTHEETVDIRRIKEGIHRELERLQLQFSSRCFDIYAALRSVYLNDPQNKFIRRFLQLSILGIVWTRLFELEPFRELRLTFASDNEYDIGTAEDTWELLNSSKKTSIIEYIHNFFKSPSVKPEALISENLWGFVLREILIAIELTCSMHESRCKMHCFSQFDAKTIKTIGKRFYTDFAFLSDCSGLPIMLIEVAADPRPNNHDPRPLETEIVHKDLKKLSIQMGSILLQLIGTIRKSEVQEAIDFISDLRVFGALILGTKIEFCVSRVIVDDDGKFAIFFETRRNEWSFNLFEVDTDDINKNVLQSTHPLHNLNFARQNTTISPRTRIEDLIQSFHVDAVEEYLEDYDTEFEGPSACERFGNANMNSVSSITKWINFVHSYYCSLPSFITQIYLKPNEFDHDHILAFPAGVHEFVHTSASPTTRRQESMIFNFINTTPYATPSQAPTEHLHATLPTIKHIEPSSLSATFIRMVHYYEGISMAQVEDWIERESDFSTERRIITRARFLVDILIAIFKASQAGFVFSFSDFDSNEITFRNELFCIKTYRHVKRFEVNAEISTSLEQFVDFYLHCWFLDNIFNQSSSEYGSLGRLEGRIFSKIEQHGEEVLDWRELFSDALADYKSLLEHFGFSSLFDTTHLILRGEIEYGLGLEQTSHLRNIESQASSMSSVEYAPIAPEQPKQEKAPSTTVEQVQEKIL